MSTKTARTITRDAAPARTIENRVAPSGFVPESERDPNKIYSRDGRELSSSRPFTGDEDRFNLAAVGVYPPDGWVYQWKTKTVKNWDWIDHQVELFQNGWTPVPAERHDGKIMPLGHAGNIEKGGLILMECDARQVARLRQIEKRKADEPVRDSRSMAGLMGRVVPNVSADSMNFSNGEGRDATYVRSTREAVRNDAQYSYKLDE